MSKILVTGCAGFIGFHLCRKLLSLGYDVCGLDNLNEYYDRTLKAARLALISDDPRFRFVCVDLVDRETLAQLFASEKFEFVAHLAAQAGVRYSLENPQAYVDSNLIGFVNIIEGCRHGGVKHLVFASSSSVYGANTRTPFSEHHPADHPISLYAATKRANELMAHAYAQLYQLPATGLRFFTVYGPWGRPDMALFLFTKAILRGDPIHVFNAGRMQRDFTYIDDVIEGILRTMERIPESNPDWNSDHPDPGSSSAPFRIYNLGNHQPVELLSLIRILESKLGKKAQLCLAPLQPGDVLATYADVADLARDTGFRPQTPLEAGIERFVDWYRSYYAPGENVKSTRKSEVVAAAK
ncbi:MAG TPA: NAD-dependent epimerase [Terriglobia bacterium]|nr:NAD-dependent epimerase [Terriglobia bacterium]